MKAESDGFIDAVGDIDGARLGPYVSQTAAQADYAARQAAKKQVPVPFKIAYETFQGVTGWWVINTTWKASQSLFQVRALRPDYTGPMNAADKLRVAADLRDPVKNARAAYVISGGGKNFGFWSVYVHETYLKYLDVDFPLKTGHARAADWDV